jgi:membrane protein
MKRLGLNRVGQACRPTVVYWMETESHVYGFSIAANVLLSFFPFLIVMVSLCKHLLHWNAAEDAIYLAMRDYFPGQIGDFIVRNLRATVESRGPFQLASVFLLLFTANGVFEPLEVALNRAWGIAKNRSFFKNQLVSLGLIFACGGLALLSTIFTAMNTTAFSHTRGYTQVVFFKAAAVPLSILGLFLIYWLLPNCRIPARQVIAPAILVGLSLEALKYVNLLTWPWLRAKLEKEYGPFVYSVTIILWSFLAAMIILAGAEWSARRQLSARAAADSSRAGADDSGAVLGSLQPR